MVYKINLIPGKEVQVIRVSQGDTSLRRFIFRLKHGTRDFALTTETVEYIQSNGAHHACTVENGYAVLDAYEDMTADPGKYFAKLKITDNGGVIYSATFVVEVEAL